MTENQNDGKEEKKIKIKIEYFMYNINKRKK
jgi:hypothetical protein